MTRVLLPADVGFDNSGARPWTEMEVRGPDTPAFLYALANALSMRGVAIQGVEIASVGGEARDRFAIADRDGHPITTEAELADLRLTVGLIKQFTHFLPSAPDPARALGAFDQLLDRLLALGRGSLAGTLGDAEELEGLARVLGSSRFLWEDFLRMQAENLLPLLGPQRDAPLPRGRERFLAALRERLSLATTFVERQRQLNDYKDRLLFEIDLKRLLDPGVTLGEFSAALTELAEAVIEAALAVALEEVRKRHGLARLPDGTPCPVAVFGLGKLGGRELGYASDIEVLFVYGDDGVSDGARAPLANGAYFDAVVRSFRELVEARQRGIFEIDLRLRPYGKKGPLASGLAQLESYYSATGDAGPFERQALTKLRWCAGDEALGRRVEALRDRFVYGPTPWDRADALRVRGRQLRELVRPGEINVKLGVGGLIDIEYAVQYLQIQYGATHPEVRTPSTLEGLARLASRGVITGDEEVTLREAYEFWRRVIDGLRMVRGDAKDLTLPAEGSEELRFLARRLGVTRATWDEAAQALLEEALRHRTAAHAFYLARFGDPLSSTRP